MKRCPSPECTHLARFGRVAEYRDDAVACSDCGGPLEAGEAPATGDAAFRELVTVYEAPDPIRGHLLESILLDRGIPAVVVGDALAGALGELPAPVLQIRVQVPPAYVQEAEALARSFERGELALE